MSAGTEYDYTQDIGYFKFAAMTNVFCWLKSMHDAGVEDSTIVAYYDATTAMWAEFASNYVGLLAKTPANTRSELGELELVDVCDSINELLTAAIMSTQAAGDEVDGPLPE